MAKKSKHNTEKPDFRVLIPGYSDDKILEILKKRKHYQPEAAQLAVEEAIKRGIIHSEQDLFAEDFKEKPLETSVFPKIEDKNTVRRIRRSIARMLMLVGLIPIIYGIVKLSENLTPQNGAMVLLGVLWIYLSVEIFRKMNKNFVIILFFLLSASALYMTGIFMTSENLVFMDIFAAVMFYLLFGYGLLFLLRLKE